MPKQFTANTPFSKERRRRSVKLTPSEHSSFKAYVDSFDTQLDAVEALGLNNRQTLYNIYVAGSGNPDNIQKIRDAVKEWVA